MLIHAQGLITSIIKDSLLEFDFRVKPEEIYLDIPQNSRFGDLSSNIALRLSKVLKRPPVELAEAIVNILKKHLADSSLKEFVNEIKIAPPGFINFYFSDGFFYEQIKAIVLEGISAQRLDAGGGRKALIEFVSANPTGPLSVAHARQAAIGDSLANILDFLGFKVQREYYLNDAGNQINILGRSVELRLKELKEEKTEFPENYYQGDYIYIIAREILALKKENCDFSEYAKDYILKIIKQELADFGVKFDSWYSQMELEKSGKITQALQELKAKGLLYDSDGAVWFKSSEFGDDKDRVVIKADGAYTYLAPDIAYHQEKYKRGFQWLINLWGPDHHGYINRVKASIKAFGHNPDSLSIIIVQLATIFKEGKPVQMSTRKGQYITLREVLDEVGSDAARFFFIMRRTQSHLDFDLDVAKKQTQENPVYYVQYAYARISSILKNSLGKINFENVDLCILKEKEELKLIKKLCQFSYILQICLYTQDPYMLTVYLGELAEDFHKFYDLHRVLGQTEELTNARLAILNAARIVISAGLDLLRVSKPETM